MHCIIFFSWEKEEQGRGGRSRNYLREKAGLTIKLFRNREVPLYNRWMEGTATITIAVKKTVRYCIILFSQITVDNINLSCVTRGAEGISSNNSYRPEWIFRFHPNPPQPPPAPPHFSRTIEWRENNENRQMSRWPMWCICAFLFHYCFSSAAGLRWLYTKER